MKIVRGRAGGPGSWVRWIAAGAARESWSQLHRAVVAGPGLRISWSVQEVIGKPVASRFPGSEGGGSTDSPSSGNLDDLSASPLHAASIEDRVALGPDAGSPQGAVGSVISPGSPHLRDPGHPASHRSDRRPPRRPIVMGPPTSSTHRAGWCIIPGRKGPRLVGRDTALPRVHGPARHDLFRNHDAGPGHGPSRPTRGDRHRGPSRQPLPERPRRRRRGQDGRTVRDPGPPEPDPAQGRHRGRRTVEPRLPQRRSGRPPAAPRGGARPAGRRPRRGRRAGAPSGHGDLAGRGPPHRVPEQPAGGRGRHGQAARHGELLGHRRPPPGGE